MGQKKDWSQGEIDYLQDNWGICSVKAISEHLGRSINAIQIMKNRLALGAFLDNGEYITFNQLLLALGITGGSIYKNISWIKNRSFPVKYKTVLNCKFKIVYINDFWKWAEKNQLMIDWSKVEMNILGEEPAWVKKQREVSYSKNLKIKNTPWTKPEDENLMKLLKEFRYDYINLSQKLQRSEGAIQRRINDLGIKERPLKADNHTPWTDDEYLKLSEMLKQRVNYELMSCELGKSSKAIRGRVYNMYLTESIDKVATMIGTGNWGDGRPERKISHRLLSSTEKAQVKSDMTRFVGLLKGLICSHYSDNDYWQRELCMNWNDGCIAGELNCDNCTSFIRIQPQYCNRCGATFLKRKKADICDRCAVARKKQYQRKYMTLYGEKKAVTKMNRS